MARIPASRVPEIRIRVPGSAGVRANGQYVLYWMTMARRPGWTFALQRAVEWAHHLGRPLLVRRYAP